MELWALSGDILSVLKITIMVEHPVTWFLTQENHHSHHSNCVPYHNVMCFARYCKKIVSYSSPTSLFLFLFAFRLSDRFTQSTRSPRQFHLISFITSNQSYQQAKDSNFWDSLHLNLLEWAQKSFGPNILQNSLSLKSKKFSQLLKFDRKNVLALSNQILRTSISK